jgi:hypothetical protein
MLMKDPNPPDNIVDSIFMTARMLVIVVSLASSSHTSRLTSRVLPARADLRHVRRGADHDSDERHEPLWAGLHLHPDAHGRHLLPAAAAGAVPTVPVPAVQAHGAGGAAAAQSHPPARRPRRRGPGRSAGGPHGGASARRMQQPARR